MARAAAIFTGCRIKKPPRAKRHEVVKVQGGGANNCTSRAGNEGGSAARYILCKAGG